MFSSKVSILQCFLHLILHDAIFTVPFLGFLSSLPLNITITHTPFTHLLNSTAHTSQTFRDKSFKGILNICKEINENCLPQFLFSHLQ